ncbi:hypothetical protein KEM55_005162 [Ascosphaera atra]|nr:hypothetical protein KEM55_005162 [Ascosphaera atra]
MADQNGIGDSYTETGFDPNGRQPSLAYPLGNTNQHPSGFLNYVWYLTRSLNGTTVLNYNLARSGAFVSKNVTPSNGFDDLEDEVSWWQGNYTGSDRKERWHANDTVASFWFGVNE